MTAQRLGEAKLHPQLAELSSEMKKLIIGQPAAIDQVTSGFTRFIAGMGDREKPLLSLLFVGTTGVGKTELVRVLADMLFGNRHAFTKIAGEEFASYHNMAKLIGSPPGYVGGEIIPILAQAKLDEHCHQALLYDVGMVSEPQGALYKLATEGIDVERMKMELASREIAKREDKDGDSVGNKKAGEVKEHKEGEAEDEGFYLGSPTLSLVLIDEIEKAEQEVWNLFLGILDEGRITLAQNDITTFEKSIIIATSNIGSQGVSNFLAHKPIGFLGGQQAQDNDQEINKIVRRSLNAELPRELINRFDAIVYFRTLPAEDLRLILNRFIFDLLRRARKVGHSFSLNITPRAKNDMVARSLASGFGARELKRIFEADIATPLAKYVASEEIETDDLVLADIEDGKIIFAKEPKQAFNKVELTSKQKRALFEGARRSGR